MKINLWMVSLALTLIGVALIVIAAPHLVSGPFPQFDHGRVCTQAQMPAPCAPVSNPRRAP